jgi:O-succinylbenzoate synthase
MRFSYEKVAAPFDVPVNTSRGLFPFRESIIVTVETGEGRSVRGEVAPWPGFSCETLCEAESFLEHCCSRVPAMIPKNLPCTAHAFSALKFFLENPEAQSRSVPPENHCARLIRRFPETDSDRILDEILRERENNYSVFKLKIGLRDQKSELKFCEKILECVPKGVQIRFDANGSFSEAVLPALAELSVFPTLEFFEQPLPPSKENDVRILDFAANTNTKLALDESVSEPWTLPQETPVVAVVKPLCVADFPRLLSWLEAPCGADVVVSTLFENSPAGKSALYLACSLLAKNRRRAFGMG